MPSLSVVVAAQDAGVQLARCLAALMPQLAVGDEAILVDGSEAGEGRRVAEAFPWVRYLRAASNCNVPQLWSAGIAAASGEIVALTIENCAPAPDWAVETKRAHEAGCAGIGGAIEIAAGSGLVDWAVYFCRYSNYMLPFSARFLEDIPADNCSYRRAALGIAAGYSGDGFWETFVHQEMTQRGEKLLSHPGPVMVFNGGIGGWRFFRRRYVHGRYFAARRGAKFSSGQRWLRAALFPAVPLVLMRRIGGRVWRNGRHRGRFVLTAPLVAAFLVAWGVGEAAGYLSRGGAGLLPCRE